MFWGHNSGRKRAWVIGVVCFVLLGAAGLSVAGIPLRTDDDDRWKPQISWNPKSVVQSASAGSSTNVTVSLTALHDLKNVCLRVSRKLDGMVQVNPTNFPSLTKGQTVQIAVNLDPLPTFPPSTVDGLILVRARDALEDHEPLWQREDWRDCPFYGDYVDNISPPLQVRATVTWAAFSDTNTGVQLSYPDFGLASKVDVIPASAGGTRLEVSFRAASSSNFASGFDVILFQNTNHLSLSDWFHQNVDPDGSLISGGAFTETTLSSGLDALVVSGPVPEDVGPVMAIYSISASGSTAICMTPSQDNQFDLYGLSPEQVNQMLREVLTNLKVP